MEAGKITRMTPTGRVAIPEEVRTRLGLKDGATFVVLEQGEDVLLKVIHQSRMPDFDEIIRRTRAQARKAGLRPADVRRAISRVRGRK